MPEQDHNNAALIGVADQVQAVLQDGPVPILLVMMVAENGEVEFRSPLPEEGVRYLLNHVASTF